MYKVTTKGWGWPIVIIHWATAICVFGLFGLDYWMVDLSYYHKWYNSAPYWYKSIGILVAIVTVVRLLVVRIKKRPAKYGNKVEKTVSTLTHGFIYLLLFSIFASGYLISTADGRSIEVFTWFSLPSAGELFSQQSDIAGELHEIFAWSLLVVVVLHALGALKHHFIDKDQTLKQMFK